MTLGDEEARRRGTQKTVLERKAPPTFDVVVEIVERDSVTVHRDVAETVDAILRGHMVPPESRFRTEGGELKAMTKYDYRISETAAGNPAFAPLEPTGGFGHFSRGAATQGGRFAAGSGGSLRPLPGAARLARPAPAPRRADRGCRAQPAGDDRFVAAPGLGPAATARAGAARRGRRRGVGRHRSTGGREPADVGCRQGPAADGRLPVRGEPQAARAGGPRAGRARHRGRELEESDAVVTLRNYYKRKPRRAPRRGVARRARSTCSRRTRCSRWRTCSRSLFDLEADPSEAALRETSEAIGLVAASGRPMELSPQNAYIRRLQHQMAERNNLMSRSRGAEPNRRVELLPDEGRAWR